MLIFILFKFSWLRRCNSIPSAAVDIIFIHSMVQIMQWECFCSQASEQVVRKWKGCFIWLMVFYMFTHLVKKNTDKYKLTNKMWFASISQKHLSDSDWGVFTKLTVYVKVVQLCLFKLWFICYKCLNLMTLWFNKLHISNSMCVTAVLDSELSVQNN